MAQIATEHHREVPDGYTLCPLDGAFVSVFNIDVDFRRVCRICQSTFHRCESGESHGSVGSFRSAHADVRVAYERDMVDIGGNDAVCREDGFDIDVDKVIVRVKMLFDEALDLEKGREELPFVLRGVSGRIPAGLLADV